MAKSPPWSVKGTDEDTRKVARPGVTVGLAFGTTALAALLLVTIVLRFGDLSVPAVRSTDAARERAAPPEPAAQQAIPETPPRPAATAEKAKPEAPPRPAATAEKAKPEASPRLAATTTETAPASSPPIPAIGPLVPTPGPIVALDTGWQPPSRRLDRAGIAEVQRLLAALRFTPGAANGVAGAGTVAAIRLYQQFAGLPVDGAATEALLRNLREITGTVKADTGATTRR